MSSHSLPYDFLLAPWSMVDPGASGNIDMSQSGRNVCHIVTAAAESRTVLAPTNVGLELILVLKTDGGDCTVTVKDSADATSNTIVLTAAGQWVRLVSVLVGSTYTWIAQGVNTVSTGTGVYQVPLTAFRVHDAAQTNLPATAANDDMAIITGTPGTDALTLQGVDFGGTSTDEKAGVEVVLPADYVAGGAITVRVRAAMLTSVSDGTATVDVECWKPNLDGAVGSDLCTTAAQSINSLTPANKDFTITPTGLVAGDRLQVRLAFAGSDTGNAAVMIPEISNVELRYASNA